jgi:hypothetical protein
MAACARRLGTKGDDFDAIVRGDPGREIRVVAVMAAQERSARK